MANHLTVELAGVQAGRRFSSAAYPFASDTRKQPVVHDSESYSETVRVKLPAGFAVDETPESGNLDAPDYSQVCDFFGRVLGSEQSPVVLLKR